jgi:hypothetical protein
MPYELYPYFLLKQFHTRLFVVLLALVVSVASSRKFFKLFLYSSFMSCILTLVTTGVEP